MSDEKGAASAAPSPAASLREQIAREVRAAVAEARRYPASDAFQEHIVSVATDEIAALPALREAAAPVVVPFQGKAGGD